VSRPPQQSPTVVESDLRRDSGGAYKAAHSIVQKPAIPVQDPYPVGQGVDEVESDLPGRYLYALKVEGESSMEPAYRDGEIVYVDPEQRADEQGALGIWKRSTEKVVTFKRLMVKPDGRHVLQSLNPKYPEMLPSLIKTNCFSKPRANPGLDGSLLDPSLPSWSGLR
jgi:Peptidase S24-like